MPHTVKVLVTGPVELPNGGNYVQNQVVVLSDSEFALLNPAALLDGTLQDLGSSSGTAQGNPATNPRWSTLGQPTNIANSTIPAATNLSYTGINGLADTAASLVSGVMTAVAVPVDIGTVITKIQVQPGATGASTPTHSFGALYKGTTVAAPPLIGQSTDGATAVIAASTSFGFTLATAYTVTSADAPWGFLWVAVSVTASTVPSLVTVDTGAAAAQYAWFTNVPGAAMAAPAFCISSGSAVAGTAPATLIYASQKTTAPVVFLL